MLSLFDWLWNAVHQFYLTKAYFHINVINNFFPLNYGSEVEVNVHSREFDMTKCTSEASSAKLTKIPKFPTPATQFITSVRSAEHASEV